MVQYAVARKLAEQTQCFPCKQVKKRNKNEVETTASYAAKSTAGMTDGIEASAKPTGVPAAD